MEQDDDKSVYFSFPLSHFQHHNLICPHHWRKPDYLGNAIDCSAEIRVFGHGYATMGQRTKRIIPHILNQADSIHTLDKGGTK